VASVTTRGGLFVSHRKNIMGKVNDTLRHVAISSYAVFVLLVVPFILYLLIKWNPVIFKNKESGIVYTLGGILVFILYYSLAYCIWKLHSIKK